MKALIMALITVATQASMANCLGEAQIIAKVQSVSKTWTSCVAHVSTESIKQYNESMVCPLDLSEVLAKGVEVGFIDGHDCRLQPNDAISGVLVKTETGRIILE